MEGSVGRNVIGLNANVCQNPGLNINSLKEQQEQLKDVLTLLGFKNVDENNLESLVKAINDKGLSLAELENQLKALKIEGRISPQAFDLLFGATPDGQVEQDEAEAIDCWEELEDRGIYAKNYLENSKPDTLREKAESTVAELINSKIITEEEKPQAVAICAAVLEEVADFTKTVEKFLSQSDSTASFATKDLEAAIAKHPELKGPVYDKIWLMANYQEQYATCLAKPVEELILNAYLDEWENAKINFNAETIDTIMEDFGFESLRDLGKFSYIIGVSFDSMAEELGLGSGVELAEALAQLTPEELEELRTTDIAPQKIPSLVAALRIRSSIMDKLNSSGELETKIEKIAADWEAKAASDPKLQEAEKMLAPMDSADPSIVPTDSSRGQTGPANGNGNWLNPTE